MDNIHPIKRNIICWLTVLLASGTMLPMATESAYGADRGPSQRGIPQREFRQREVPQREFRDERYHHDRSYPSRGWTTRELPRDRRIVVYGGTRYYFSGGAWYRRQGPRYGVIAPPIGLFIPFLPPYYTTIWLGGVPYYYANEIYYAHQGDGYVVVEPPRAEVSQAPPPADKLFIYPRLGQSEQQQADDQYACHRWSADQTGFDPTQPPDSPREANPGQKRADYQRAMAACLDGRGYTVK